MKDVVEARLREYVSEKLTVEAEKNPIHREHKS